MSSKTKTRNTTGRGLLAVSLGCPAGIGPLVSVGAAASTRSTRCVLVGDRRIIERAASHYEIAHERLVMLDEPSQIATLRRGQIGVWRPSQQLKRLVTPGRPTAAAGRAQLSWIDEACALVEADHCGALVTGPVSKQVIAQNPEPEAQRFRGHTEHLARRLGVERVIMAFYSRRLTVSLATTHLPLSRVAEQLSVPAVCAATVELASFLFRLRGQGARIVVCGLNPHAGEGGLLGSEEQTIIAPALSRARRLLRKRAPGSAIIGPIGAESAFRQAAAGHYDGVVAMYHDQATIACKLLGFGEMVNVTLGLPLIRVSVDHGTAYDAAAQHHKSIQKHANIDIAELVSSQGMRSALQLGNKLTRL